jgi:hypothetical protein
MVVVMTATTAASMRSCSHIGAYFCSSYAYGCVQSMNAQRWMHNHCLPVRIKSTTTYQNKRRFTNVVKYIEKLIHKFESIKFELEKG